MTDKDKTRMVHAGRPVFAGSTRAVNPPLIRASTVLYGNSAHLRDTALRRHAGERNFSYGARGTPTVYALEDAITEIEGGARTQLFPTGLAAIAHVFLSLLKPGDHVLLAETIYGPARAIADDYLVARGIACEYYPAGQAGPPEVARRLKPNTRLVYLDNPGSIVYDVQDLPAIAAAVRAKGSAALIAVDNTWGAGGIYRPLALGAAISIIALTKYIAGHSDVTMGSVTAQGPIADQLWRDSGLLGQTVSPDDAYQVLRGLRTVSARIEQAHRHAMDVITWLQCQPQVERVLFPPLPEDPGHALWQRDFDGAISLFSVILTPGHTIEHANRCMDALRLFGIGASWGGFESLALTYAQGIRGWSGGALIRLHVGLEDPADLIADLAQGLAAMGPPALTRDTTTPA
jgi:cysteine-S-conjugate beta-lyase